MPKHEEEDHVPAPSSSLYVYPVRSLLTGIHASGSTGVSDDQAGNDDGKPSNPDGDLNAQQHQLDGQGVIMDTAEIGDIKRKGKFRVNYRYFPGEDDNPLSFATSPLQNRDNVIIDPPPSRIIEGPVGEPIPYIQNKSDIPFPSRPEPISSAAALAMSDGYPGSDTESSRSSLVNAGLVHLAPIRSEDMNSTLRSRSRSRYQRSADGSISSGSRLGGSQVSSFMNESDVRQPSSSDSKEEATGEPLITFRFQHVQLSHGEHHVIVGREGKLNRCEDEVRHFRFLPNT